MNVSFYIAKRYLFAKKSRNAINIISFISVMGVAVGTMALVVVLSVFNGFDEVIQSLINAFDPDLKITLVEGKTFLPSEASIDKIRDLTGVAAVSEVMEENALVRYDERQFIATMKGVDSAFVDVTGVDSMIIDGRFTLHEKNRPYAVVGQGVAYSLHVGLNFIQPLVFYVPKRTEQVNIANPSASFNRAVVFPSGVFSIQQEYDSKYIILPVEVVRALLEYHHDEVTSLEIRINKGAVLADVQKQVAAIAGDRFQVLNRYQQNEVFYRIMKSEKWATFLILTLILVIASFNIIGSLTMLIIDKKSDITTLRDLGADNKLIRKIFLSEGWLISIIGSVVGIILGTGISLAQEYFKLVKIGGAGTFVIDAYPVHFQPFDIFLVWVTVLFIGFLAAWFPARKISVSYLSTAVREM